MIQANCQTEGLTLSVCKVCGDEKRTISKKLNHTGKATEGWVEVDEKGNYILTDKSGKFDASKIDNTQTAADCEHDLIEAFECDTCNKIQVKVIAKKLGHRIDSTKDVIVGSILCDEKGVPKKNSEGKYVVTKGGKSDCQHAEVKLFTCANEGCKQEKVVVLTEKLDHTPKSNTTVVYGATCNEEGRKTYTCATCNEKIEEKTNEKALGHNYAYEAATCIKGAAIVCTRGCDLKGTEAGYDDFYDKTLTKDQQTAVDKNTPLGHDFVGTVVNKNSKYYALCRTCGEKEVTFDSKANTITSVDTLKEVWAVTVDAKTGVITVGEKGEVDSEKTPLSISSVKAGVHQSATPQANNITVSSTGKTVTVTETAEKVGATTNPNGETKKFFCLVLDLGIAKDKVKVSAGDYKIEADDLTCVDQWTTSSNGNQFLVWLSAEKCGDSGITITFSDADNVKAPIDITFNFVANNA